MQKQKKDMTEMFEVGAAAVETAKKGSKDFFEEIQDWFGGFSTFFFKMCYCHFLPSRLLLRSEVLHKEPCPEDEFWSLL